MNMTRSQKLPVITVVAVLILIGMSFSVFPVSATIFFEDGANRSVAEVYDLISTTKPPDDCSPVVFFYDPDCESCIPVHEYLTTYIGEHSGTKIEMLNLSNNLGEEQRLNNLLYDYHREWMNVPVVFIGPVALEGTDDIINGFEEVYVWYVGETPAAMTIWDTILRMLGFV
jgi:hypothetical protein